MQQFGLLPGPNCGVIRRANNFSDRVCWFNGIVGGGVDMITMFRKKNYFVSKATHRRIMTVHAEAAPTEVNVPQDVKGVALVVVVVV